MSTPRAKQLDASLLTSTEHSSLDHSSIPGVGGGAETESVTSGSGLGNNISRTIPGGTLSADNESLDFKIIGRTNSGDNITVTFASLQVLSDSLGSSISFEINGTILRTGPNSQIVTARVSQSGGVGGVDRTVTSGDMSTALTLVASDSSNQVTFDALIVRKWAA